MGRLNKLSRRVLASGAILAGCSVIAQGLFSSTSAMADGAAGSAGSAGAGNPDCTALPGITTTIIVSGSSAVQPTVAALGTKLASATTSVIYSKQGSCAGVGAILGTPPTTSGTAQYWDTTTTAATPKSCTLPANTPVDVGVSDVFATSCSGVNGASLGTAGVSDFDTFFAQVMEFIVPGGDGGSDQTAISAEAAYLTFGFGNNGATPWNKQAQFLVRNSTSGTQVMLSRAIGLDPTKWLGFDESNQGGAGQIFKDIKNRQIPDPADSTKRVAGDPKTMIGIVSSGEADADTANVKRLAFQATGQTCAFWPDSGVSALDKKYVRDGHYPVWGPLHVLAKATNGVPTSAGALALINFLSNTDVTDHSVLDVEIGAHVVPLCAMNVTRTSELGPMSSSQPTGACGCYFDSKTAATLPTECVACTPATAATKCKGDRKVCNYGFCEVK